jgi:cell division control protein 6
MTLNTWQAIFRNAKALAQTYIPKQLLYREGEYKAIANMLSAASVGLSLQAVLAGPPGSGKTVTVMKALEDTGVGVYTVAGKSGYETLVKMALSLGLNVPPLGLSFDHLWRLVKRNLPNAIILDEADKMMGRGGNDLLYELSREDVTLILITNVFNFYEKYVSDVRIRSTFRPKTIFFSRYNTDELEDILRSRAEEAFQPGVLDEGVIPCCAALASEAGGDARYGIDLLKKAGEVAASAGEAKVTEEHIYKAKEEVEGDELAKSLTLMKRAEQALLYIITEHEKGISPSELYNKYTQFVGSPQLSIRTLREYLRGLELGGFIRLEACGRGKGRGVSWIITPSFDAKKAQQLLKALLE